MHEFSLLLSPNFCREQAGQDVVVVVMVDESGWMINQVVVRG
jgi:hypothetical protein